MSTPTPVEQASAQLRQRADDARREADRTADPIARETLIAIAMEYEKLADLVQEPSNGADEEAPDTAVDTSGKGANTSGA